MQSFEILLFALTAFSTGTSAAAIPAQQNGQYTGFYSFIVAKVTNTSIKQSPAKM